MSRRYSHSVRVYGCDGCRSMGRVNIFCGRYASVLRKVVPPPVWWDRTVCVGAALGNSLSIRHTGNAEGRVRHRLQCRHIGKRKVRTRAKLDESKVRYILRKNRNGISTATIAKGMNVSARWIRKLCARYRNVGLKDVAYPMRMGSPGMHSGERCPRRHRCSG